MISGDGLAATPVHVRRTNYEPFFLSPRDRFHKIRIWSRDKLHACPVPGVPRTSCRRRWTLTVTGAIINALIAACLTGNLTILLSKRSNCRDEGQGWPVHPLSFPPPPRLLHQLIYRLVRFYDRLAILMLIGYLGYTTTIMLGAVNPGIILRLY